MPMRPSQQSTVPFEQARKAEKIFEQAIKDHAEGRLSSARMNAKLAVMYDPSVPAYLEFLTELDRAGAAAKSPHQSKPRELLLFEQASEKEGKGDYEGAVMLLQEAIEVAPRAAALRNRLGVVLSIRLKRHDEALAHLKVAIELEPGNIVYMNNYSKVTAMLDSELEHAPEKKKGKKDDGQAQIAIKKIRPKMF
jgi:tetratricopeptide (TPR) repeat protein